MLPNGLVAQLTCWHEKMWADDVICRHLYREYLYSVICMSVCGFCRSNSIKPWLYSYTDSEYFNILHDFIFICFYTRGVVLIVQVLEGFLLPTSSSKAQVHQRCVYPALSVPNLSHINILSCILLVISGCAENPLASLGNSLPLTQNWPFAIYSPGT